MPFEDFLKYDAVRTTAKLRNPGGYYRALCRKFVKQVGSTGNEDKLAADVAAMRKGEPTPPRRSKYGRCSKCTYGKLPDGENCECKLGREVAKLVERQIVER